jgi:hypothetical protein
VVVVCVRFKSNNSCEVLEAVFGTEASCQSILYVSNFVIIRAVVTTKWYRLCRLSDMVPGTQCPEVLIPLLFPSGGQQGVNTNCSFVLWVGRGRGSSERVCTMISFSVSPGSLQRVTCYCRHSSNSELHTPTQNNQWKATQSRKQCWLESQSLFIGWGLLVPWTWALFYFLFIMVGYRP